MILLHLKYQLIPHLIVHLLTLGQLVNSGVILIEQVN
jgi:hypothetical protein